MIDIEIVRRAAWKMSDVDFVMEEGAGRVVLSIDRPDGATRLDLSSSEWDAVVDGLSVLGLSGSGSRKGRTKAVGEAKSLRGPTPFRADPAFPNAGASWTIDQDAHLERRWSEGASVEEVASELGRRPGSVPPRLLKRGLIDTVDGLNARSRSDPTAGGDRDDG